MASDLKGLSFSVFLPYTGMVFVRTVLSVRIIALVQLRQLIITIELIVEAASLSLGGDVRGLSGQTPAELVSLSVVAQ